MSINTKNIRECLDALGEIPHLLPRYMLIQAARIELAALKLAATQHEAEATYTQGELDMRARICKALEQRFEEKREEFRRETPANQYTVGEQTGMLHGFGAALAVAMATEAKR